MHQLGDKIEERELGVCDAVFRAAQDMSVDNGLLDAMEENFRLPALGTMTCCILCQIKVCQVRAAHGFVVVFADGRARELLLAVLLAAWLFVVSLAQIKLCRPTVQHMNGFVINPCGEKQLPIWGHGTTSKLMTLDGATGGGTGLLEHSSCRRSGTCHSVGPHGPATMNAVLGKKQRFMQ